jgi:hypothetical protein
LHPKLLFKPLNLRRYRRLREVELLRRVNEALPLDDGDERGEVLEFQ